MSQPGSFKKKTNYTVCLLNSPLIVFMRRIKRKMAVMVAIRTMLSNITVPTARYLKVLTLTDLEKLKNKVLVRVLV